MGETAENLARRYQIPRDARKSSRCRARSQGGRGAARPARLDDEIVPIARPAARVEADGCIRPDTSRRGAGRAVAGVRSRRHRHRRHLLAAHRRRRGGAGLLRGLRRSARARSRSPASRASRSPAARPRSWASARCWPAARRWSAPASGSATSTSSSSTRRSPRRRSPASASSASTSTEAQSRRRRDRARAPAGRHRRPHHRQGGGAAEADGQALCPRHQCIGGGQGIATVLEAV